MSQATFDEDDLFDEAADDIRTDVEDHLDAAEAALPAPEEIWEAEAENTLGVLNTLRSALDTGDAADHLRDAKKSHMMGERAEVFGDGDDLDERITTLDETMADIETAHDHADELASTVPELRGVLDDLHTAEDDEDDDFNESEDGAG
jgi:vacuolar-type H+-ATPase subunit I/STV1